METTRRTFLAGLAAASVPAVAVATPAEDSADRVERLSYELADAMNEYAGGKFHAVVYPSERAELPVSFQKIAKKDHKQEMRECLSRLDQLLSEETGNTWTIVAASDDKGKPGIFSITGADRDLHDPFGMFGEKLHYGKPIA